MSSGTIAAAVEGALAGRPAVALSFPFFNGYGNWQQTEIDASVKARDLYLADEVVN